MIDDNKECGRCRFFHRAEENPDIGTCCRYPPILPDSQGINVTLFHSDRWPLVWEDEWCGEFRRRKAQG